ncbi:MAG: hypothetical protein NXI20_07780 [bacterium]|nr:hypothetical protein [bacterium]
MKLEALLRLKPILLVGIFICISITAKADPIRQAIKALNEGDFGKTEELLMKSAQKDSLNPAPDYLFALLFQIDSFSRYNLDTSYSHINTAIQKFDGLDEKGVDKLARNSLYLEKFNQLKETIEHSAFKEAKQENEIVSLESFMEKFDNEELVKSAGELRDSLAYLNARKFNTWQSFKYFLKTYPNAKYAEDAKKSYDWLLFKDKTAGNLLGNLEAFYAEHQDSPYLDRVIKEIYVQRVADNSVEAHQKFLDDYPDSNWSERSKLVLFHLQPDNVTFHWSDSLKMVSKLNKVELLPFYDGGKFGFMGSDGEVLIEANFESVIPEYVCEGTHNELLEVEKEQQLQVISRNGKTVLTSYDSFEDLGFGYLSFERGGKIGVVHKSGYVVTENNLEDVLLIGSNYLGFQVDGKWGISTLQGETIIEPYFDEIEQLGDVILLYKQDKIHLKRISDIKQWYRKEVNPLKFEFEEVEEISNSYLIGILGDQECLLDDDLEILIPLDDHSIYSFDGEWYVRNDVGYRSFDIAARKLSDDSYQDIQSNQQWLGLRKDNKWSLFNRQDVIEPRFKLDSIKLISEQLVYLKDDLFHRVIFGASKEVPIGEGESVEPIISHQDATVSSYISISKDSEKSIYNPEGDKLFQLEADEIFFLNDSTFIIERDRKKGLVNRKGKVILKVIYQSLEQDSSVPGLIHLLKSSKIGAYFLPTNQLVDTKYESRVILHDSTQFIVNDGGFGLWDVLEKEYIGESDYQGLVSFSQNYLLCKLDDQWVLKSTDNEDVVIESIYNYEIFQGSDSSKVLKFRVEQGYGLFDSKEGLLLKPEYNEILEIDFESGPIYYAERFLEDAELYVTLYLDQKGNKIRSQAFDQVQYEKIACDL